jgi:uncharacterized protein YdiU (UPF0061 family)
MASEAAEAVAEFVPAHRREWYSIGRRKLGLTGDDPSGDDPLGDDLVDDWVALLASRHVDHTLGWRGLAEPDSLRALFSDPFEFDRWRNRWETRTGNDPAVVERIRSANPRIVPRNHLVEAAISAAVDNGDLGPFDRLLTACRAPFDDDSSFDDLAAPAPPGFLDGYRTFCGT